MPSVPRARRANDPPHPIDRLLRGAPRVLALKHLKEFLGISPFAVQRWIREDGFPEPVLVNGNRRWPRDDVREWLVTATGRRLDHLAAMRETCLENRKKRRSRRAHA
jgi:predicted DNA-binding transcriptional regulator AlpA